MSMENNYFIETEPVQRLEAITRGGRGLCHSVDASGQTVCMIRPYTGKGNVGPEFVFEQIFQAESFGLPFVFPGLSQELMNEILAGYLQWKQKRLDSCEVLY